MSAHETLSDEALLRRFVNGDRFSLGALAQRYERRLLGLAKGLLGDAALACDAVQETWVRVIRFAPGFAGDSSFKTWIYRIAVNQCYNLRGLQKLSAPEEIAPTTAESGARPVDGCLLATEQATTVWSAVAALTAEQRDVVLLCYHADLTHSEAAVILEIPLGTLKSRLHAALGRLRALLAAEVQS
ncbi:MAG: RNA polymerase sigma factor [Phycisphaerales bacterium]|nr:RNA polymerase sigma factor [Phycisphaerales bacterium]